MKFAKALIGLAFAADAVTASTWFSKAAYNKWHETELERWLSDNNIPYPTPSDRKDLEKLVQNNWDNYVVSPYRSWDSDKLSAYLKAKGVETKDSAAASKDSLVNQVSSSWYETEDKAQSAWTNVKDWILDTWTESQLKSFCDHHGIPVPQPRKRDTILAKARNSYDTVAQKAGEAVAYPGNWLYDTWSESDLKEWLDTHGFPAPQPTTRDKLIASVRRNSRLAYLKMQEQSAAAQATASAAYASLTDKVIDAWSESQLKEFADKNSIPVPQGTKLNELRALVRKHRAEIIGDTVSGTAASAFGAATSKAGNEYAKATNSVARGSQETFNQLINTWSDSRLKGYLDARGVPVPQATKTDELRALVRKHSHKAASGWTAWTYDDFSLDSLKSFLAENGDAAAKKASSKAGATRDDLIQASQDLYSRAYEAGGSTLSTFAAKLHQAVDAAQTTAFNTWTDTELKAYLDSCGIPVPQGSKTEELKAAARKHATYFKYGTTTPPSTILAKLGDGIKSTYQWALGKINAGAEQAQSEAAKNAKKLRDEL